jgi:hypothetical protein
MNNVVDLELNEQKLIREEYLLVSIHFQFYREKHHFSKKKLNKLRTHLFIENSKTLRLQAVKISIKM